MKVLICGGRFFANWQELCVQLDTLHKSSPITEVIHGDALGADSMAADWARLRGIPQTPFPADWRANGRSAGPIRNQKMLDEGKPDLVIAFPGGTGTADMIARSRRAGVKVLELMR
jgi:hypothetical protein